VCAGSHADSVNQDLLLTVSAIRQSTFIIVQYIQEKYCSIIKHTIGAGNHLICPRQCIYGSLTPRTSPTCSLLSSDQTLPSRGGKNAIYATSYVHSGHDPTVTRTLIRDLILSHLPHSQSPITYYCSKLIPQSLPKHPPQLSIPSEALIMHSTQSIHTLRTVRGRHGYISCALHCIYVEHALRVLAARLMDSQVVSGLGMKYHVVWG
jgi:hypothetical protein